jgi:hypothetical protein
MSIRLIVMLVVAVAARSWGASYYTVRLDDPKAVYLTPENFPVKADGVADDTEGVQQAINKVQETTGQGIVFVPEGRYRLTKTIYVWHASSGMALGGRRWCWGRIRPGIRTRTRRT